MEKSIATDLSKIGLGKIGGNLSERAAVRGGGDGGPALQLRLSAKRAIDLSGAIAFLLLFAPFMLVVALLALAFQGRPILFAQKRLGKNGAPFPCFKFRTMAPDGQRVLDEHLAANPAARREWAATQKLTNDPRITPLGHVMRKLSVDELPQFINVVRGEMSLVGPRPIVASEIRFYGQHIDAYQSVRPGITGPWQVGGRSNTSYARRVQLDVEYVRDWSLTKDMLILAKTVPAVLSSDGSR